MEYVRSVRDDPLEIRARQAADSSTPDHASSAPDHALPAPGPGREVSAATSSKIDGALATPGHDLAGIRVHAGPAAAGAAAALGADAWTVGRHIGFAAGAYRPDTAPGARLLRHELAHTRQAEAAGPGRVFASDSTSGDRYTPGQRAAMHAGTITGGAGDLAIATSYGFQPGDIVFRFGAKRLAEQIKEPVTHGGVYLGGGLIHDMVAFGNRDVKVSDFYAEAEDPSVVKVIRFTGPLAGIIIPRVVGNLATRDVQLPTDPVPWNLFSSALDYRTATCLEYSHAQFLYAILQISREMVWSEQVLSELRSTYFKPGSATPGPLIQPKQLTVEGAMGIAVNERRGLMAGADYVARDVDPTVFANRWEGREELRQIAPVVPMVPSMAGRGGMSLGSFWQREILESFTYRSFADAKRFFTVVR
jgi:hypothetical protein